MNSVPEEIEAFRDYSWRREPERAIETAAEAEKWIETIGFCRALTDARQPGASLYIAVCGRRDAFMPRNVQKDAESSLTWRLKDEVLRRGRVYYGKLSKAQTLFIAARLIEFFNALWGVAATRRAEAEKLSDEAQAMLKVLRREGEMATSDLRRAAHITERGRAMRALDELQRTMKVVPSDVLYKPTFTYIWTPAEYRFPVQLKTKVNREDALREVARAFLDGAGMTLRGELAKATGLSRVCAGLGNRALVAEGYAERITTGVYRRS